MSSADALSVHRSPRTLAYAGERCPSPPTTTTERAPDARPAAAATPAPGPTAPTTTAAPAAGAPVAPTPAVRQAARARAVADAGPRTAAVQAQARAAAVHWPLTVQPGDSLSQIAARYRRPDGAPRAAAELLAHNPQLQSRPDLIHPGEVLRIPRSWVSTAPTSPAPARRTTAAAPTTTTSSTPRLAPVKALRPAPAPVAAPAPAPVAPRAPVERTPVEREPVERAPAVRSTSAGASDDVVAARSVRSAARDPARDARWASIVALGPVAAHPGNVYEQAIAGQTTAAGLQRFVDGALDTLARRHDDTMARSTWTRNLRVALGRAEALGVTLR